MIIFCTKKGIATKCRVVPAKTKPYKIWCYNCKLYITPDATHFIFST